MSSSTSHLKLLPKPIKVRVNPWLTVIRKYADVVCADGCGKKASPWDQRVWATNPITGGPGNGGVKKKPTALVCHECMAKRRAKRDRYDRLRIKVWGDERRNRKALKPVKKTNKRSMAVLRNITMRRRMKKLARNA